MCKSFKNSRKMLLKMKLSQIHNLGFKGLCHLQLFVYFRISFLKQSVIQKHFILIHLTSVCCILVVIKLIAYFLELFHMPPRDIQTALWKTLFWSIYIMLDILQMKSSFIVSKSFFAYF